MKLLKAIKSTFEAIGMAVFIYIVYVYFDRPYGFILKDFLICGAVSVFTVWLINKIIRWQGENFELEECPWCGAELDFEEMGDTNYDSIRRLDIDGMGKFLMDFGLACIKNEEPKDIFKWLEERAKE